MVNNVETLACVPHIIERGGAWYAAIGTERSTGPKLFSVSGHVNRPGVYEVEMGVPFREIIYGLCGGVRGGRALKAFIPGGSSCPVLPADKIDIGCDFESVAAAGSMLGSGGLIVMDETVDMVWALENLLTFYAHESCGQCTPWREGSDWALDVVRRIRRGFGRPQDLETLRTHRALRQRPSLPHAVPVPDRAWHSASRFSTAPIFRSRYSSRCTSRFSVTANSPCLIFCSFSTSVLA